MTAPVITLAVNIKGKRKIQHAKYAATPINPCSAAQENRKKAPTNKYLISNITITNAMMPTPTNTRFSISLSLTYSP